MKPGLYLESIPCNIAGSPAMAVCDTLAAAFSADPGLASGVGIAITPLSPRHLWVSMIRSVRPGSGMGGRVMDHLCGACDAHGVTVELQAIVVDGAGGLGQDALDAFYARCGFVRDRRTHRPAALTRTPRGSSLSRAA